MKRLVAKFGSSDMPRTPSSDAPSASARVGMVATRAFSPVSGFTIRTRPLEV